MAWLFLVVRWAYCAMLNWMCLLVQRTDAEVMWAIGAKKLGARMRPRFGRYWNGGGMAWVLQTLHDFQPETEQYESVRAACMVLGCFGSAYAWPSAHLEERMPALQQAITLLTQMLNPPDDAWGFLDMWNHDEAVVKSVERQIALLNQHI